MEQAKSCLGSITPALRREREERGIRDSRLGRRSKPTEGSATRRKLVYFAFFQ